MFSGKNEKMTFEFFDDCIKVSYSKTFNAKTPIFVSKMFATDETAINVVNLDRGFTPQARNNRGENDPGEVYSFKNEDDKTSIDRNFTEARDVTSETEMNYVNN